MYSYPTTWVVIKRNLKKKKDQTLKTSYKNTNCLRRDSRVPFQSWRWALPGWDSAPDLLNGLASALVLGLQFPHLYQGEVNPIVSESLWPWHQVTRRFTVYLGYAGPSLCCEDSLQKQRLGPWFGSGCRPPRSVGDSRAAWALWADQLSCPPGAGGALPGPQSSQALGQSGQMLVLQRGWLCLSLGLGLNSRDLCVSLRQRWSG